MQSKQLTLDDSVLPVNQVRLVRGLSQRQIDCIRLLDEGYHAARIARRLKVAKSYVLKTINKLLRCNLVILTTTKNPVFPKAKLYRLTPQLKSLLIIENPYKESMYTLCTPHHIKLKYDIIWMKKSSPVTDAWKRARVRAIHIREYKPRGSTRHLFRVDIDENEVTIEYHGKSLLASLHHRKKIIAESSGEATTLAAAQIQKGVEIFVREQKGAGNAIRISDPRQVTKTHYSFESKLAKQAANAVGRNQLQLGQFINVDMSPKNHGRPENGDIETQDPTLAEKVDRGLRNALNLDTIIPSLVRDAVEVALPFAIQQAMDTSIPAFNTEVTKVIDPTDAKVDRVAAMIQGNVTIQQQYNQMVNYMTKALDEMAAIRKENAELKKELSRFIGGAV